MSILESPAEVAKIANAIVMSSLGHFSATKEVFLAATGGNATRGWQTGFVTFFTSTA
jgi:hypothetical protein